MKAINIIKYGKSPLLNTVDKAIRKSNQYLIKMKYAPINPSDLNFYLGSYGIRKQNNPIMGFEGSGVIQYCQNKSLVGRVVSVVSNFNNGTYSEYISSKLNQIMIYPQNIQASDLNLQYASMAWINPISVIGLSRIVQKQNVQSVVLSAIKSNVSKMIVKYINKYNKRIKNIIGLSRSAPNQNIQNLNSEFTIIYNQNIDQIKQLLSKYKKSVFIDCVGGTFAGKIFNILPEQSIMINYGRLSKQNLGQIDLAQLYFKNKKIRGFWMNTFLNQITQQQLSSHKQTIIQNQDIFKQKIRKVYQIQHFSQAFRQSLNDQSLGKILLKLS